jgi:endonuclease/exonuclease/phosphatase family metal-dependent hydrolase
VSAPTESAIPAAPTRECRRDRDLLSPFTTKLGFAAMPAPISTSRADANLATPHAPPVRLVRPPDALSEPRTAPDAQPSAPIRIATWNVEYAPRPDRLARALKEHTSLRHASVILLQEVEHHDHEPAPRAERLARALGLAHVYAPARALRRGTHGLAILSRFPLTDVERIPLPAGAGFYAVPRVALAATVHLPDGPLRVVDVHLDTRLDAEQRVAQIAPALAAADGPRALVAGDLNTTPFRFWRNNLPIGAADQPAAVDRAAAAHDLANATAPLGPTTRRRVLAWRLDAIYTRGLRVAARGIARTIRDSDHVPLWIDLA